MVTAPRGMAAAREWIEAREGAVPPTLRRRVRAALEEAEDASVGVPEALAGAALRLLRAVVAASGDAPSGRAGRRGGTKREDGVLRATAVDLLAADALLTWACEAAAEEGPETLAALTEEYGPERLAALSPGGGAAA